MGSLAVRIPLLSKPYHARERARDRRSWPHGVLGATLSASAAGRLSRPYNSIVHSSEQFGLHQWFIRARSSPLLHDEVHNCSRSPCTCSSANKRPAAEQGPLPFRATTLQSNGPLRTEQLKRSLCLSQVQASITTARWPFWTRKTVKKEEGAILSGMFTQAPKPSSPARLTCSYTCPSQKANVLSKHSPHLVRPYICELNPDRGYIQY